MMWKNTYLTVFLVMFFFVSGTGQNIGLEKSFNPNSNRLQGKLYGEVYYMSTLANSKFFLQNDWVEGTVILTDGDIFTGVRLRYLAKDDELVAYNDNLRSLFIVDRNTVKEFKVEGNNFGGSGRFVNLGIINISEGKNYFELLCEGTASLLAYHWVEEIKVSPFTDSQGMLRDSEYRLNESQYLLTKEKDLIKIQRKKSALIKIYPEHRKEIKKILRRNKIILFDDTSLIQVIKLLDEAGILK
ncbi:MAG: hypothetical protein R2757_16180 [Draconibacterium sp.]